MSLFIFTKKIILISLVVFFYYKIVKDIIYYFAPSIADRINCLARYPSIKAAGIIEIVLIASSHLIFFITLSYFLNIFSEQLGLNHFHYIEVIYGILLGIGMMAITTMLCRFIMVFSKLFFANKIPKEMKSWMVLARGGWMRHHLHNFQILPFFAALLVLFVQIGSEEIIFRGILINYFLSNGILVAIILSTLFFVLMQAFQTPNWIVAMFPMVGSLVSGVFFSIVYLKTKALISLIIAHVVFFIIAAL